MKFTWSDEKSVANLKKHSINFEQACEVFNDPFAIEFVDDRFEYGETRYVLIGMSDDLLLVVVHAEQDDVYRIISARKAEPNERRFYQNQNK